MAEKRLAGNEHSSHAATEPTFLDKSTIDETNKSAEIAENENLKNPKNQKLDMPEKLAPTAAPTVSVEEDVVLNFPESFLNFLRENNVNPDIYKLAGKLPRFIRVRSDDKISRLELENCLNTEVYPVPWCSNFYQLDGNVKIAGSSLYKEGRIYGIDVSSGAAVMALHVQEGDNCLDMCCAPGAKLCMLAEAAGNTGTVTGVDISKERLSSCRTVISKYRHSNIRLFNQDATKFNEPAPKHEASFNFPSSDDLTEEEQSISSKEFFVVEGWNPVNDSSGYYDKILVDAECTHDGSLKHITKYNKWGWDTFEKRFLDPERISTVSSLQKKLLHRAFNLLKPGGYLVYSTCSFTKAQNEDVVEDLLIKQNSASLVEVDLPNLPALANPKETSDPLKNEIYNRVVRFDPIKSGTSGLFIARIKKRAETESS